MKSIKDIYKIGKGPSSSHTMGPAKAMSIYVSEHPEAESYSVVLYGSLADTGEGHGTDRAIRTATDKAVEIVFSTVDRDLPHENTMDIYSVVGGELRDKMRVMSVGGGDIEIEGREDEGTSDVYPQNSFTAIAEYCKANEIRLSDYVLCVRVREYASFSSRFGALCRMRSTRDLSPRVCSPADLSLRERHSSFTISVISTSAR